MKLKSKIYWNVSIRYDIVIPSLILGVTPEDPEGKETNILEISYKIKNEDTSNITSSEEIIDKDKIISVNAFVSIWGSKLTNVIGDRASDIVEVLFESLKSKGFDIGDYYGGTYITAHKRTGGLTVDEGETKMTAIANSFFKLIEKEVL